MFALSVIAIIYTSLVALVQEDMKKLIAYSSVAHMGFVTMGIFAATAQGVAGGIFQMVSHGVVSAALFLCVGVVYDRMHSREISTYGGLVNRMPVYAAVFLLFTLANVGLPGTSGFVGEFLTLLGTFRVNITVATLATLGVILSACYALWLYRKVIFGKLEKPSLAAITDMGWREIAIFAPLIVLTLAVRLLSQAGARHVGGLGDGAARQLPACARRREIRRAGEVRPCPMNAVALSSMTPVLPEIVLAVGAMALLMLGAYRERSDCARQRAARSLLLIAAARDRRAAFRTARVFGGSFIVDDFARFMKILAYAGSAFAIVMSLDYLAPGAAADASNIRS